MPQPIAVGTVALGAIANDVNTKVLLEFAVCDSAVRTVVVKAGW